jgi:hypothetical protein
VMAFSSKEDSFCLRKNANKFLKMFNKAPGTYDNPMSSDAVVLVVVSFLGHGHCSNLNLLSYLFP